MITLRKKAPDKAPENDRAGRAPVRTDGWTTGMSLGRKAVSAAIILALCSGPASLVIGYQALESSAFNAAPQVAPDATTDKTKAGAFAAQFVLAWLTSSRETPGALEPFGSFPTAALADRPQQATDAVVADVEQGAAKTVWAVTVAVRVLETSPAAQESKKGPTQQWVLRWFRVPVASAEGAMVAGTLPAPVPGPATLAAGPGLAYHESLPSSGGAYTTVSQFLAVLLTGRGGDLNRYLAPAADPGIRALTPSPYASLSITSVTASKSVSDAPTDGDKLHVIAAVSLFDASGSRRSSDIPLVLGARAGRWEVLEMPAVPEIEPEPTSTPTTQNTP